VEPNAGLPAGDVFVG